MAEEARAAGVRRARSTRRVAQAVQGRRTGLDTPLEARRAVLPTPQVDPEAFGRWSERFARFMGTASFLVGMTVFVAMWLLWNTIAPAALQFDPRSLNYTLLTLILSMQASYAAPLILLAQNRQADRDRISLDEDRATSERLQADVEYLAREVAALRQALGEVPTRDYLRDQLRELADDVAARSAPGGDDSDDDDRQVERQVRRERDDRERRAERKKKRRAESERAEERPDLGEPFVGEPPDG